MSEIERGCPQMGKRIDELVTECASWVEWGGHLSDWEQNHLAGCPECRDRALELLQVERRLGSLKTEAFPDLDITAAVMARCLPPVLDAPAPAAVRRFPLLAWAPMLLLAFCWLPDPDWLPGWLGLRMPTPELSFSLGQFWNQIPLDATILDALLGLISLMALTSVWQMRKVSRA